VVDDTTSVEPAPGSSPGGEPSAEAGPAEPMGRVAKSEARPRTRIRRARAASAPTPSSDRLVVGLVRGLHGLNGAVRVEVLTDDEARFEVGSRVFREGTTAPLDVMWVQPDAPGLLVRFSQVTTRDAAESLRDAYLEVDRPDAALPDGAVYWHEVIGVPVATAAGEVLGTVADIFRVGGNEVFVVRGGARGEVLVPAVKAVITMFRPGTGGRIEVDQDALGLEAPAPRRPRGRRSSRLPAGAVPARSGATGPSVVEPQVDGSTAPDFDGSTAPDFDGSTPADPG
jgi:16S rRNA processing protein RimM